MARIIPLVLGIISVAVGQQIVENGDFSEGLSPWKKNGCKAEIQDGAVHVIDRDHRYAGIYQMLDVELLKKMDMALRMSFSVKADKDMEMNMQIRYTKNGKRVWNNIAQWKIQANKWEDLMFTYSFPYDVITGVEDVKFYTDSDVAAGYWLDNVVFEPADDETWRDEANKRIDKLRKRDVRIRVEGNRTDDLTLDIKQVNHAYPFGTCVEAGKLSKCLANNKDSAYCKFIKDNYNWIVDVYTTKWYYMEPEQGSWRTEQQDGMIEWANRNGLKLRGHTLLWAKEEKNPWWVKELGPEEFIKAVYNRLDKTTKWGAPSTLHWDVNNEMINHHFYEERSEDPEFRKKIFQRVRDSVPNVTLFVNDYGILNNMFNRFVLYQEQIRDMQADGVPFDAIGIQSHLGHTRVDAEYFKYVVETLHNQSGLPVWITEFDWNGQGTVKDKRQQINAKQIEDFYRIMFSLEAVEGILMWGFQKANGAMVNKNMKPNAAGKAYLKLYHEEWRTNEVGTPTNGEYTFRGFRGDYVVKVLADDGSSIGKFKFTLDEDKEIVCTEQGGDFTCSA